MKHLEIKYVLEQLRHIEGAYNDCVHLLEMVSSGLHEINEQVCDCREIEELLEFNNQVVPLLQHASEKSNKLFELFRPIPDIDFTKKKKRTKTVWSNDYL